MVARMLAVALAAALLAGPALLSPSPASAGTYDVRFCTNTSVDGVSVSQDLMGTMATSDGCGTPHPELGHIGGGPGFNLLLGETSWTLVRPNPSVSIVGLSATTSFTGPWETSVRWTLTDGNGDTLDSYAGNTDPLHTPLPTGKQPATYPVPTAGAATITSRIACPGVNGCIVSSLGVRFTDLTATMEDDAAPTLSNVGGSLSVGGTVSGLRVLSFLASDAGSGIAKTAVLVDGSENVSFSDDNGGNCVVPYTALAPCVATSNAFFNVDTTKIPDGTRTIEAEAIDASGNVTKSAPVTVTVRNAPTSTAPPAIQGTARIGSQLTATSGTWDGNPTKFAYQWERCSAAGSGFGSCKAIAGATSPQYTLTSADIYGRIVVKVTASNVSVTHTDAFSDPTAVIADANGRTTPPPGGGGGGGGPSGTPDTTAPVLSAVSLTRARFGVSRSRTAIAALVRGTSLRLTSSEGGQLSIAVVRVRPGQRKGTVCRVVSRPVARGRCTALTSVATLTRSIGAGRSSVALSGRIGAKALAAGSYRLVLTVRDGAGNVSAAVQRSFTILRG